MRNSSRGTEILQHYFPTLLIEVLEDVETNRNTQKKNSESSQEEKTYDHLKYRLDALLRAIYPPCSIICVFSF